MSLLGFIADETLYDEARKVIEKAQIASDEAVVKLHNNIIDPFSAVFDSLRQNIGVADWVEQEKARQIQKTMQNALGDFHQGILASVKGWENLKTGRILDIKNSNKKIIAEIKNKHNTTKGNHKKDIYDDIESMLAKLPDYTGYYVEVIPKTKKPYNKPFAPSDNVKKERRPINEQIRVIDGYSFYGIATGYKNALLDLYKVLPTVIADILNLKPDLVVDDEYFLELFTRAYPNRK